MTTNHPAPAAADTKPLTLSEYRELLIAAIGPDLATFRRMEAFDSNTIWRLDTGTVANLLEEAIELIDKLTGTASAGPEADPRQ